MNNTWGDLLARLRCFFRRFNSEPANDLALRQQNLLVSVLMNVEESAVLVNDQGILELLNPAAEKLFRCHVREARGRPWSKLFQLLDPIRRVPVEWATRTFAEDGFTFKDCLLTCKGMNDFELSYLVRPIQLDDEQYHYLLLLKDQSEFKALQAHLRYVQTNDQQTRLMNRKSFENHLKIAMNEVESRGVPHTFCFVSLDQFKVVNDTAGHSVGDSLLEGVADVLKRLVDSRLDVLARIGGDEFGIILGQVKLSEALKSAENIRRAIKKHSMSWDGHQHKVTASLGLVPLNRKLGSPNRVISLGDAACRVAKAKGGNSLYVYRPDDKEINKYLGQAIWVNRLNKAFEKRQFKLYAQPIHPLASDAFQQPFLHYEILTRLFDDQGSIVSPDEFIPAAEYYSMMPKLDRWVITELLMQVKQLPVQDQMPLFSINLSGQSLDDPEFLPFVLRAVKKYAVPTQMICFEITERLAISNRDLANRFISTMRSLGCRFSLDDFGTGVSSFSYLKELSVDYLKIDGSFIKNIATDEVGRAMVQSVNQVGQLMSVKTVAEYVENDHIINVLREIGIDYGQGYGIAKPTPLVDILESHY